MADDKIRHLFAPGNSVDGGPMRGVPGAVRDAWRDAALPRDKGLRSGSTLGRRAGAEGVLHLRVPSGSQGRCGCIAESAPVGVEGGIQSLHG